MEGLPQSGHFERSDMRKLELKPDGWPCKLKECPPGLFLCGETVGLKSEYKSENGNSEAFCDSGEAFWGDANRGGTADDTIVQPLIAEWIEE